MAYHPIVINLAGSPVIDPFTDQYFTVPGNQLAVFTPGTPFVVFDNNTPTSNVYAFTVQTGSPNLTNFNGTNTEVYTNEAILDISPFTYQQAVDGGYTIPFSDPAKSPIVIDVATSDSTTSLELPGRGKTDYGEIIDRDLLHLLENFAGPVAPGGIGSPFLNAPVEGQLWFDTSGSPPQNIIRVWDGATWSTFAGSGKEDDVLFGSGAFSVNLTTDGVTPINVNVQPRTSVKSFQQVFLNGVLQREDTVGFPSSGNYYITGIGGNVVFAFDLVPADEVLVYAL